MSDATYGGTAIVRKDGYAWIETKDRRFLVPLSALSKSPTRSALLYLDADAVIAERLPDPTNDDRISEVRIPKSFLERLDKHPIKSSQK